VLTAISSAAVASIDSYRGTVIVILYRHCESRQGEAISFNICDLLLILKKRGETILLTLNFTFPKPIRIRKVFRADADFFLVLFSPSLIHLLIVN